MEKTNCEVVPVPSSSTTFEIEMVGGASSSTMVTVVVEGEPIVAPTGAESVMLKVSSASSSASFEMGMLIVWLVWPGPNVTVPVLATYSDPAMAEPLLVV